MWGDLPYPVIICRLENAKRLPSTVLFADITLRDAGVSEPNAKQRLAPSGTAGRELAQPRAVGLGPALQLGCC